MIQQRKGRIRLPSARKSQWTKFSLSLFFFFGMPYSVSNFRKFYGFISVREISEKETEDSGLNQLQTMEEERLLLLHSGPPLEAIKCGLCNVPKASFSIETEKLTHISKGFICCKILCKLQAQFNSSRIRLSTLVLSVIKRKEF